MQCGVTNGRPKRVRLYCDNWAAVAVLNVKYSHDPLILHLPRYLFFVKAYIDLDLRVVRIPGKDNVIADTIFCDDVANSTLSGSDNLIEPNTGSSKSGRDLGRGTAQLDIGRLGEVFHKLFSGGLATSAFKSYSYIL